jgi:peroxiredoxin
MNRAISALLPCIVFPLSIACGEGGPGPRSAETANPLVGAKAPPFDLPAQAGGGRASLNSVDGKVVVVDFWATWCEPCKVSFPKYQALLAKYDGDFEVVGISEDDEPDGIPEFAKETGVKFVLAWDRDKRVAERYKPDAMPTGYIVDKEGVIRHVHAGYHEGEETAIEGQVKALLSE